MSPRNRRSLLGEEGHVPDGVPTWSRPRTAEDEIVVLHEQALTAHRVEELERDCC